MPPKDLDDTIDWSRPTPNGEDALAVLHRRLRRFGVPEGPQGYDLAALELAVAIRGWISDAGPARTHDRAPFLAMIYRSDDPDGAVYVGWGWSEAVALARTLAHALTIEDGAPLQH